MIKESSQQQDEFCLTLPSNSSKKYYGKQETAHYFTKLHGSVTLDPSEWMVGLAEITYPKSYDNIPACDFVAHEDLGLPAGQRAPRITADCTMQARCYISPQDLIREWKDVFQQNIHYAHFREKIKLSFNKTSQRCSFEFTPGGFSLILSNPLAISLGFEKDVGDPVWNGKNEHIGIRIPKMEPSEDTVVNRDGRVLVLAHHPVNVDRLIPMMYIYSDLVECQRVGDAYVPLLRTLTVPVKPVGELVTETFHNVHYCGVERGTFESVEIQLVDRLGINIPFQTGDVIVKLHFKHKTWAERCTTLVDYPSSGDTTHNMVLVWVMY